ncbi:sensor histidine kinase [Sphingobium subterraneum]|nr:ATP-binding protein [Sphingobium subterraneum]
MNQGRTPRWIASLAIMGAGAIVGIFAGINAAGLLILLICAVLIAVQGMTEAEQETNPAAPPIPRTASTDLLDNDSFTRILDGLADPMIVVDQRRVALANRAALRLLGNHIVGEDIRLAIRHPAAAERLSGTDPVTTPLTLDIVGLGARDQRWSMQIVPIDADSGAQRLLVHMLDQTSRYAAERARVDFVANASHELRTPLAAILGFIETLADPDVGADLETRTRFLGIVDGEARRMQQLVDDLMSLSRIEADKHRLPAETIDIGALAKQVAADARQSLGKRGQDIACDVAPGLGPIQGDTAQLSQLLHNLVNNSAKYGRAGTPIGLSIVANSLEMLRITVSDEGEGISPDHLPRLTERFYRVDSGRSRAVGGTGLGLAIVKHIVERHRGRLDISSVVGKGTTVSVLLPTTPSASSRDGANPDTTLVS